MQGLLLADFPRNIKELEMEIRKACATACVRVIEDVNSSIEVCLHDFSSVVQKVLLKYVRGDRKSLHCLVLKSCLSLIVIWIIKI